MSDELNDTSPLTTPALLVILFGASTLSLDSAMPSDPGVITDEEIARIFAIVDNGFC